MSKYALIILSTLLYSSSALAYVGPGLGVGVIGAIVGVVLAVVMAIIGVFWYPLKRMFKKDTDNETLEDDDGSSDK